jgi:L-ascorbate metabolism protein UlaG (beta-lactamase superfamily)
MRLRLGRPDLARYADRFDVPAAGASVPRMTFLGVSTLLLDDDESALLTDGFFTRPGLLPVALGRIGPDEDRIATSLRRAGVERLDAVLPVHSHFDHVLDSAAVARRTGARLVGGTSTLNVGRGGGLPEERLVELQAGRTFTFGHWTVEAELSTHCPPDRYPGVIDEPLVPPAKAAAYRCGEAWSLFLSHVSGATALVQGSAGFVPGALAGRSVDVVFLGIGQLGLLGEDYLTSYWTETVRAVRPRRVVAIHWDDFFRPLPHIPGGGPLQALPYAGDDLDVTLRVLGRLADEDGVPLCLPRVWERQNPWAAPS